MRPLPRCTLFPYTTLFRSNQREIGARRGLIISGAAATGKTTAVKQLGRFHELRIRTRFADKSRIPVVRSEEHTSELQSRGHLVCRLLLEKKKNSTHRTPAH